MSLDHSRRGAVPPFLVMRVMHAASQRRAAGLPVYDLSVGQPATAAPASVLAAAQCALQTQRLAYSSALGIAPLQHAIAGHYRTRYAIDVDPDAVAVVTGSSGGFLLAFLAAFDAGDTVVLARPGYPAYRNLLHSLGCRVLELSSPDSFQLSLEQLEALPELPAGVVLASPANPTGAMVAPQELDRIVAWCAANSVRLISDEIYHGITYTGQQRCAWAGSDRNAIVVGSFSKYFSMTGWRLGWLLLPEQLRDSVDRLAGNFALCPPVLSQHAAVAAFDAYDELDANVARYAVNRESMLAELAAAGVDRVAPADGAFYVYADVSAFTNDSLDLSARLLADTGVAVASGVDFDPVDGNRFIRLCFAGDAADIENGLTLLGRWLA